MEPMLGMIIPWPVPFAPMGWELCDGRELQVMQNQALFSLIGNIYGGDGRTTFALPNLCSRTVVGVGSLQEQSTNPNSKLGGKGGAESVMLTAQQVPAHTHPVTSANTDISKLSVSVNGIPYNNGNGTTNIPAANVCLAKGVTSQGDDANIYANTSNGNIAATSATVGGSIAVNVQVGNSPAASQAVPIVQPYLRLYYIIATQGIYPQRP